MYKVLLNISGLIYNRQGMVKDLDVGVPEVIL
jgi:hypothetical protein